MKKKSLIISLFLLFLLLFVGSFKVNAAYVADGDFMLFICCPGEDSSTEMNFSWHSYWADSYVEVALKSDGNFDNATKVYPTVMSHSEAYPFQGTNWGVEYPDGIERTKMNVCEATAKNLTPGTEYMYRGYANNKYTETRYFTTAGDDGVFVFAVMADPQVYASSIAETANKSMNKAMANAQKLFGMDIEVVLGAGDMVTYGGNMAHWEWLFNLVELYKYAPLAGSTGNHDYCDIGNGKVTSGSYLTDNAYNHPKNGCEGYGEACYYFKWNNVLFVTLDSEVGTQGYINQGEWLKNLLATETYQYTVVMCHRPAWGSTDSTNVVKYWDPIFKEYNIDLFFSGHNHDYGRGSTNVGVARGQKSFPNNYIAVDDTGNLPNGDGAYGGYCLIKVTPTNLFYYAYDQYDNCRDQYVFSAQRSGNGDSFDKDSFMDSMKIEVLENDSSKASLSWKEGFADSVTYISVLNPSGTEVAKTPGNSENKTSLVFGGLSANETYTYKVKVEYKDGTSSEKEITFETKVNYGKYSNIELKELSTTYRLMFDPSEIKNSLLEKVNVYIDGELKTEYSASAKFVAIEKDLLTSTSKVELKGVVKSDKSEVLIGTFTQGEAKEPVLTVETKDFELEVESEKEIKASVDSGKVVYTSSDSSIATVDANGKVKGIKAGSVKIVVSVEGYSNIKQEINVKVKEKASEEATKLSKPEIKLEETTLTINSVNGATQYEIYIDGELKETVTNLTKDLSKYALGEGSYKVKVKAKASNNESEFSNEVTFVVKGEEPSPTPEPVESGCNSGSIQAIWYIVSILGLALVLKKKRF